ncbi:hypothetical protein [Streptomyces sp. NBC_00334]|uniref:hypothetical protein n=1 Tax=Streptomyces sp. NBC_00334 TaxID=2975713 RepID=UPI002E281CBA|nr:hypothetical protein [Streptomyces sp. NBC_00334]
MTEQTTPQSGPILDLETAVRELGALPMPAGPEPKPRTMLDHARAALNARMTKDDLRLVLENTIAFAASLEADREASDREYEAATARVAELESEQHTTNEALSDAAKQLRKDRDRIAELEAQRDRRRGRLIALQNDALSMRGSLSPAHGDRKVPFELGETLTPAVDWLIARAAELESKLAEFEQPADEDPIAYALTAQAGSEAQPTLLRWGLNDVMWGDDDSVTMMLSGPSGEPYWLELDPERATVLREDLAGPDAETGGAS